MMTNRYFLVNETYENWLKTQELNFSKKGFKDKQSRVIINGLKPDDILVFYISRGISALGGIARVISLMAQSMGVDPLRSQFLSNYYDPTI